MLNTENASSVENTWSPLFIFYMFSVCWSWWLHHHPTSSSVRAVLQHLVGPLDVTLRCHVVAFEWSLKRLFQPGWKSVQTWWNRFCFSRRLTLIGGGHLVLASLFVLHLMKCACSSFRIKLYQCTAFFLILQFSCRKRRRFPKWAFPFYVTTTCKPTSTTHTTRRNV